MRENKEVFPLRTAIEILIAAVVLTASSAPAVAAEGILVIPRPATVTVGDRCFVLTENTVLVVDATTRAAGEYLAEVLAPATGYRLAVRDVDQTDRAAKAIFLSKAADDVALGQEGYRLAVDEHYVRAEAGAAAGAFYACQTIRQLLPTAIFSQGTVSGVDWTIPCGQIEDQPRFSWRGITLDSGRHIQPKAFIKRFIDLLALHKMNVLHWKLTEDQGWRVEIHRYPKLTEVGAWRQGPGGRYGGFYTQDDIREIVAYAQRRHVVIVPEIEMPGHSLAALTSYPELSCTGGPFKVATDWGVYPELYCAGKEETFEFLENVLSEVLQLFPSQVIHIGGDEAPKDRWKKCPRCQARMKAEGLGSEEELQSYFIKRIGKVLHSKGRQLAGWEEIMEGGAPAGAIVMSWHGTRPGIVAAGRGHDVVMLPTSHCFFDYYQSLLPGQPKANGRYIPLEKVYNFEPLPSELTAEQSSHVLGAYGCLWTEYMPTCRGIEYMAFPRTCAMAEVLWSPRERRDLVSFRARLQTHFQRLDRLNVSYFMPPDVAGRWTADQVSEDFVELEWDATTLVSSPGPYETIFFYDGGNHGLKIRWAALLENGREIQRDEHLAFSGNKKRDIVFHFTLKQVTPNAKYAIRASVAGDGGTDSTGRVLLRRIPPALGALLRSVSTGTVKASEKFIVLSEFQVWADATGPEVFKQLNNLYLTRGRCHSFDLYPRYDYFEWDPQRMASWVDEAVALGAFNVFCIGDDTRTANGHLLQTSGLNPRLSDVFFRTVEYAHERGLMVAVEPHGLPAVRDEEHFAAWLATWVGKGIPKKKRPDIIKLSIEWFGACGYNPLLTDQVEAFIKACKKVNPEVMVYVDSIGGQWLRPQPFHRPLLHQFPGTIISHYLNTGQIDAFRKVGARNMMVQINPSEAGPAAHLFLYHDKTVDALEDAVHKRVRYLSLAGVNYGYNRGNYDLFLEVIRPHLRLAPDVASLRRSSVPDQIGAPVSSEQVKAAMIGDRVKIEEEKVLTEGPLPRNQAGRPAFFGQAPDGCVIRNLAAIGDGQLQTGRFGVAHTSPWFSAPVQATFGLDFGRLRKIRKVSVVPCLDPGEDTYLARDFRLEFRSRGNWKAVPGGIIHGNSRRRIVLEFPALQADAVRLVIQSEADDGKGHYRACCQKLEVE
jgi:hexosaminidase